MTKPNEKTKILYVGYSLSEPKIAEILEPIIGMRILLLKNEIFAVHFYHRKCGQKDMLAWYNRESDLVHTGYVHSIYIIDGKKAKVVVGKVEINSKFYYMTLVNDSNISPQQVKKMAEEEKIGKVITLEQKLELKFKKFKEEGHEIVHAPRYIWDYSW